ncbi:MAG: hypothetical protein L0226_02430 [Acidobacteria bacterium]|nr:hypothetical protein [Acidobacteriota bacterium]
MSLQLISILMFSLLTFLLFRRIGSPMSERNGRKQLPTELDFQVGRSVHLNQDLTMQSARVRSGQKTFARSSLWLIAMVLMLCGAFKTAQAQQTIFNVPSTDVLDKGKVYFELDTTYKFTDAEAVGSFYSFVPRVVIGTGGRLEVGLNVNGNIQPGPDSTTISPTFKWKAYDGGDNGWAFVVGDNIFAPVRNNTYDIGNYLYAEFSKTLPTKTRLTFGSYFFSPNVVAPDANRAGGQFAIEQPVTKYLTVQADWYTGKNAAGYFTPGVAFKPHPKVTGYFGYSIGNFGVSRGNHFFYSAIGINLN